MCVCDNGKVLFLDEANPIFPEGSTIVVQDRCWSFVEAAYRVSWRCGSFESDTHTAWSDFRCCTMPIVASSLSLKLCGQLKNCGFPRVQLSGPRRKQQPISTAFVNTFSAPANSNSHRFPEDEEELQKSVQHNRVDKRLGHPVSVHCSRDPSLYEKSDAFMKENKIVILGCFLWPVSLHGPLMHLRPSLDSIRREQQLHKLCSATVIADESAGSDLS